MERSSCLTSCIIPPEPLIEMGGFAFGGLAFGIFLAVGGLAISAGYAFGGLALSLNDLISNIIGFN
ncbi:MAG: hypothetical protein JJE12_15920 [Anaerolineales bacterium]|nr:hypothetical protein [Anaerolineales bacterium]